MAKCPTCGAKVKVVGHVTNHYEAVMDEGLITALKNIVKHYELIGGFYEKSTVYMIAKKALEDYEKSSK